MAASLRSRTCSTFVLAAWRLDWLGMRSKPINIRPIKSVCGFLSGRRCQRDMGRVHLDMGLYRYPSSRRHLIQNLIVAMIDPINHKSPRCLAPPSYFFVSRRNPYLTSLQHIIHRLCRTRHLIEFIKVAQIQIGRVAKVSALR